MSWARSGIVPVLENMPIYFPIFPRRDKVKYLFRSVCPGPEIIKFCPCSIEHEIFPVHKCYLSMKNAKFLDILILLSI